MKQVRGLDPRGDALKRLRILIVDDRSANVTLLERVLERAGYSELQSTTDPTRVRELCDSFRPHLLMLDLHMPGVDGFEVLARLHDDIFSGHIVVLVLTADASIYSRRRALALGAKDFLTKPLDSVEVLLRVQNLLETHYLQMQLQSENELLAERVATRAVELERARIELLDRLALVSEYRDYTTGEHTRRVGRTAGMLAQTLGLPEERVEMLIDAAPLHDIGKLGISDAILLKPGPLSSDETALMRHHVEIGAQILSASQAPVLRLAEEIALFHHERWDGSGYTSGARGEDIPLAGRITAVADVFDALTHVRPYKPAFSIDHAVSEIQTQAGRQFDPEVVEAFGVLNHAALI